MKKAIMAIAALIAAIIGYVAAGPFITWHQIKSALDEQDAEKLSENIDFPTLRQNLKEQLSAVIMKETASEMKDNPFGGLALLFASKLVDGMVDSFVTPSSLTSLMEGKTPQQKGSVPVSESPRTDSAEQKHEPFKDARYRYDSAGKFSVWVRANEGEEIRFVLTRDGFKWRLSNIVLPSIRNGTLAATASSSRPNECLKIGTADSSVLSSNDVYTELAWKVDVVNSCTEPLTARVTFTIYDNDEFELDKDNQDVLVPANGIGKARGKMLVSPPEKARRMAKQGASLSVR